MNEPRDKKESKTKKGKIEKDSKIRTPTLLQIHKHPILVCAIPTLGRR